jgi:hypothetical protein
MNRALNPVKALTIIAFIVTLFSTYYIRSEVLTLNKIRFSAENVRADEDVRSLTESFPVRLAEYEVQVKHYDLQMDHYNQMLELYRTNYDEYVRRLKDKYEPPELPWKPAKPRSPEVADQLARINAEFRGQQYHYFESTSRLNWITCSSALALVAGLLFLIMFETGTQRFVYLVILILSFVFMIGPSFHSVMSAIVGFLRAPSVF